MEKNRCDNIDIFIIGNAKFEPKTNNKSYKVIVANEEGIENGFFSNLYVVKSLPLNYKLKKYVGLCYCDKYFEFLDDIPNMNEGFKNFDCIVPKPMITKAPIRNFYGNNNDLNIIEDIVKKNYPKYYDSFETFLNGNILVPHNMFIMKRKDFKDYVKFVFNVLNKYMKKMNGNAINGVGWHLAEILTNVFIMNKYKKMKIFNIVK